MGSSIFEFWFVLRGYVNYIVEEKDHKTKKSILDCYAIFVKDVDLSAVRVSLILFKVVKRMKLNDIFIESSKNQSRCRAFLDHLFIEGHPLAFLAMQQILDGNKADILDYMNGRKTLTLTEEGNIKQSWNVCCSCFYIEPEDSCILFVIPYLSSLFTRS